MAKLTISLSDNDSSSPESPILAMVRVKRKGQHFKHWYLAEAAFISEGGIWKDWKCGLQYRLDRRPDYQGGDQIHIRGRDGEWAVRTNGMPSELTTYTDSMTNAVRTLLRDKFQIESANQLSLAFSGMAEQTALFEAIFG